MNFDIKEYAGKNNPGKIKECAGKIEPNRIIWLLEYRGWTEVPLTVDYKRAFQLEQDGKFYQADVPIKKDLSDFDRAMLCATEKLAETMHMTAGQIIWTLLA